MAWTGERDSVPETTDSVMFWALTERAAMTPETTMVEKRMLTVLIIERSKLIYCTIETDAKDRTKRQ